MALLARTTGRVRRDGGRRDARRAAGCRRGRRGGRDDRVVLLVTGDGLKTLGPVAFTFAPVRIEADADAFLDARRGRLALSFPRSTRTLERMGRTLFEKVWEQHVVREEPGEPTLLYVDLHLVHEVTSPQAFEGFGSPGGRVRRPELTVATMDHNVPTLPGPITDPMAKAQLDALRANCDGVRHPPPRDGLRARRASST